MQTRREEDAFFFARSWLAGGLANALTSGLLNPLDVVKTRMQADADRQSLKVVLRDAVSRQGVWAGLYRPGLAASAMREMASSGPRAGMYVPVRDYAMQLTNADGDSLGVKMLAAMVCGVVGSLIANPIDVAKVRLMASRDLTGSSTISTMRSMVSDEGFSSLYKGLKPSTLRAAAISMGELGTYDAVKTFLRSRYGKEDREGPALHIASSLVTGVVAAFVAAPFDLLKTRAMIATSSTEGERSLLELASGLAKNHGWGVFLRGVVPSYLRLGPHALICFPLFELLRSKLGLGYI